MGDPISFAFGIVRVLKSAYDLYSACAQAGEDFHTVSKRVQSMMIVLEGVNSDLVKNPRSVVNRGGDIARNISTRLKSLIVSCEASLTKVKALLAKYHSFQRSRLSGWDSFKLGASGKAEITNIQADLVLSTLLLNAFMAKEGLDVLKDLHDAANNRIEVNHVAIAKEFDRRSKLSPEEYESLTRELVRNLLEIGDVDQIRDLLRRGANPNGLESSPHRTIQNTPIGMATGNPRCLAILLEYGVNISVEMKADYPPEGRIAALGIAARNGNLQAVKMLLLARANVNGPEHGTSPIRALLSTYRITDDHIRILSLLAAHGANVNETGGRWFTALQFVCSVPEPLMTTYSIKSVVEQLLGYGAKPNICGGLHGSAIHAAVRVLNFDAVQLLLQHGAAPGLRATCTFIDCSKFLHRSSKRCENVTPLELLDKLWLAFTVDRPRIRKIRTLLEAALTEEKMWKLYQDMKSKRSNWSTEKGRVSLAHGISGASDKTA